MIFFSYLKTNLEIHHQQKRLLGFYFGHLPEFNQALKDGKIMDDLLVKWF